MQLSYKKIELHKFQNVELSGFGSRTDANETLGIQKLFIRCLWLRHDERDIFIVSLDLLYVPNFFAKSIREYLLDQYDLPPENIIFSATHTHSSYGLGFFREETAYRNQIEGMLVPVFEAIKKMANKFQPAKISQISNTCDGVAINRRKLVFNPRRLRFESTSLPNHNKTFFGDINGLIFEYSKSSKIVLFSFACHPVFNLSKEISSDFPGVVCKKLIDKSFCDDAIFMQGFGGDIRPNFQLTLSDILSNQVTFREKLKVLFFRKIFKKLTKWDLDNFSSAIATVIQNTQSTELEDIRFLAKRKYFRLSSETGKSQKDIFIQIIDLGENNQFVAISAEVHDFYWHLIRSKKIIAISCTDQLIGYLPAPNDIKEGGYEVCNSAYNNYWDSSISKKSLEDFEKFLVQEMNFKSDSK